MLGLDYQELMGKATKDEGKLSLVNDYMLHKVLDNIKETIEL